MLVDVGWCWLTFRYFSSTTINQHVRGGFTDSHRIWSATPWLGSQSPWPWRWLKSHKMRGVSPELRWFTVYGLTVCFFYGKEIYSLYVVKGAYGVQMGFMVDVSNEIIGCINNLALRDTTLWVRCNKQTSGFTMFYPGSTGGTCGLVG